MEQTTDIKSEATSPKQGTHKPRRLMPLGIALLILISATSGFAGGWAGSRSNSKISIDETTNRQIISNESQLYSSLAKEVGPSVVSVNVTSTSRGGGGFFDLGPSQVQSAGTGFIVSKDGLIVTNRHVVQGSDKVTVTLSDGTELDNVEKVGQTSSGDPLDIAFLRIKDAKGKELRPTSLGDSSKVLVGEKVLAIGNALGQFQNTVTAGIISGYGRNVEASDGTGRNSETLQNLFQTDAAINQGNSGGPLLNLQGEVIGINRMIFSRSGDSAGIGFAIPMNAVKSIIQKIASGEQTERAFLGVEIVEIPQQYNIRGALVTGVYQESGAFHAGINPRDVIVKVDNRTVASPDDLVEYISHKHVGDVVQLVVVRSGRQMQVQAELKAF